ncbi:MAG: hypothetical protein KKB50_08825 [Planctomycetes bacterium]|nr:hypothetical protein [Planctomycetota bacterium]
MSARTGVPGERRTGKRTSRARGAGIALVILALLVAPGCDDSVMDEFRTAAASQLESGVNAIFDGLLTGLFAVLDPSDSSDTGGTTTGGG